MIREMDVQTLARFLATVFTPYTTHGKRVSLSLPIPAGNFLQTFTTALEENSWAHVYGPQFDLASALLKELLQYKLNKYPAAPCPYLYVNQLFLFGNGRCDKPDDKFGRHVSLLLIFIDYLAKHGVDAFRQVVERDSSALYPQACLLTTFFGNQDWVYLLQAYYLAEFYSDAREISFFCREVTRNSGTVLSVLQISLSVVTGIELSTE